MKLSNLLTRDSRQLRQFKAEFARIAPGRYMEREFGIQKLPDTEWKGRPLKTVRCVGCEHDRNVPESILWAVISLDRFLCEYCMRFGKVAP
jgi:hypothetical protein